MYRKVSNVSKSSLTTRTSLHLDVQTAKRIDILRNNKTIGIDNKLTKAGYIRRLVDTIWEEKMHQMYGREGARIKS